MNLEHRDDLIRHSLRFLLGMLLITIGLSYLLDVQPLLHIHWSLRDVLIGSGAAVAMVLIASNFVTVPPEFEEMIGRALAGLRLPELILLAAMVGLIEELLFRGVLEPWGARYSPGLSFVAVNLLFGFLHPHSLSYIAAITLLGGCFSLLAAGPGEFNLLRPIVAHAVYDLIAFLLLSRHYRRKMGLS
ncbi:CPBP family intramembrane glutamic endopeptidase [Planctomicrobium sp. SH664]|uniref:CPBP family intramembrane glutamic endopeptidase n=1 Tax=Planctomicrobium sp. SH664 TaxID=3448125 RepID=UPI003F5B9678